jgi:hypothetical protein
MTGRTIGNQIGRNSSQFDKPPSLFPRRKAMRSIGLTEKNAKGNHAQYPRCHTAVSPAGRRLSLRMRAEDTKDASTDTMTGVESIYS